MLKFLKYFLLSIVLVILLCAGAGIWLLSRLDVKAQFEAAASEATGLQIVVQGDVNITLVPALHARFTRLSVRNRGTPFASIGEADVGVEFLPLLRRELRVKRLALSDINAQVERDAQGQFNFIATTRRPASTPLPAPMSSMAAAVIPIAASVSRLTFERTNVRYLDRQLGEEITANGCSFAASDLELLSATTRQLALKNLAFAAKVACDEVRTTPLTVTGLAFAMTTRGGVVQLRSLELQVLGGQGAGELDVDVSGPEPLYRISYAVRQLRVEQLFKVLATNIPAEGAMDFSTNLSMQGSDAAALRRTVRGDALLEGRELKLAVGNLDQMLERYESSQNFNLVDVGAFFVAGPLGPALTKSYNFASIFRGTKGDTDIRRVMSRWSIGDGVAQAQDVAMATRANRVAVKGAVDFANQTFKEMSVALLTDSGCARVVQKIGGSFAEPQIEKPSVLRALAGPVSRLLGKAKGLFGKDCEPFYEGDVGP